MTATQSLIIRLQDYSAELQDATFKAQEEEALEQRFNKPMNKHLHKTSEGIYQFLKDRWADLSHNERISFRPTLPEFQAHLSAIVKLFYPEVVPSPTEDAPADTMPKPGSVEEQPTQALLQQAVDKAVATIDDPETRNSPACNHFLVVFLEQQGQFTEQDSKTLFDAFENSKDEEKIAAFNEAIQTLLKTRQTTSPTSTSYAGAWALTSSGNYVHFFVVLYDPGLKEGYLVDSYKDHVADPKHTDAGVVRFPVDHIDALKSTLTSTLRERHNRAMRPSDLYWKNLS